jgi:uncharacterized protein YbjT (DUF2867 family)
MSKVLITSIDGFTGGSIARHILECPDYKAKVAEIYGISTDDVPQDLKNKGVDIFKLDPSSPEKYIEVFKRADRIILIPPARENRMELIQKMLEACKEASIEECILISMTAADIADPNSQPHISQFKKIEESVKNVIKNLVIIRPNFYTENILLYADQIKAGTLPLPVHDGKFAPVAINDVAEAVCKLLGDPKKFSDLSGKVFTLTGSEALSGPEMAACVSKCLGSTINFKDITNEEAKKILSNVKNLHESECQVLLEFYDLVRAHNAEFVSAETYQKVACQKPTSLEDFCNLHAKQLKA